MKKVIVIITLMIVIFLNTAYTSSTIHKDIVGQWILLGKKVTLNGDTLWNYSKAQEYFKFHKNGLLTLSHNKRITNRFHWTIDRGRLVLNSTLSNHTGHVNIKYVLDIPYYMTFSEFDKSKRLFKITSLRRDMAPYVLIAAESDDTTLLISAVELGGNINAVDHNGNSPLHIAASHGNINSVRFLAERIKNLNRQNSMGRSPLHLAAFKGSVPVVRLLIAKKVRLNDRDADKNTPLMLSETQKHPEVSRILREAGAKDSAEVEEKVIKARETDVEEIVSETE
ncbi:MAG: hypothetical protein IEMM0008_0581 [bacterium]|nr:MAG: hypothetical protein IEMM0008_0581 [bacterium]